MDLIRFSNLPLSRPLCRVAEDESFYHYGNIELNSEFRDCKRLQRRQGREVVCQDTDTPTLGP
jgi:hypothetical protein